MKKKKNIIMAVSVLILLGLSFFGGMQYEKSTINSQQNQNPTNGNGTGFNRMQGGGNNAAGRRGGGFTGGEIISKDDKSVTIKLQDGGSKIIFFGTSTRVMKSLEGTLDDLTIGEQITANGSQNADGSITAQSIQTRTGTMPARGGQ